MKKVFLLFLVTTCAFVASAQKKDLKKQPSVGFQFSFFDVQTGPEIHSEGLSTVLREKKYGKSDRLNPGITLHYLQGITNNLDVMARLGGSFLQYPTKKSSSKCFR